MQKKRFTPNLFFVVAILSVVFLAYYARKNSTDEMTFKVENEPPAERSVSTAQSESTEHVDNPQEPPPAEVADKDLEPLKQWIKEESASINSPKVNLKARDEEIAEKVKSFSARQLAHLQRIAEDKSAPMNERILSTYMLGKSEISRQNLIDIAASSTENRMSGAHTESEIKAGSERALRLMAVDDIVKSKDSVENRLKALQTVISKSNDELVKKYAQNKMNDVR